MPLTTTTVIPAGWSEHHEPAANGFLTGVARIHEPDAVGEWPDYEVTPGRTVWEGTASAQQLAVDDDVTIADAQENTRPYRVSIPLAGVPPLDAGAPALYVTFTQCPDDPDLVGRSMSVDDVQHGTTNWTRDLVCTEVSRRKGDQ